MQKIEASLIILESKVICDFLFLSLLFFLLHLKLASIPDQNQEDDLEKGQAETKTDSAA